MDEPDPAQLRRNEILGGLINEYRFAHVNWADAIFGIHTSMN